MTMRIDARGKPCPQPVVMTKKALEEMDAGELEVIVDNKAASQNVARMATNLGCKVEVREENHDWVAHITKGAVCEVTPEKIEKETVVFMRSDTVGKGDDELGKILVRSFLPTLLETEPRPKKLVFMNNGVKLTVDGSPVLDSLAKLEHEGIELLVCGTCLDYFGLKDKVKVGRVSNMYELVETFMKADKIVSI